MIEISTYYADNMRELLKYVEGQATADFPYKMPRAKIPFDMEPSCFFPGYSITLETNHPAEGYPRSAIVVYCEVLHEQTGIKWDYNRFFPAAINNDQILGDEYKRFVTFLWDCVYDIKNRGD